MKKRICIPVLMIQILSMAFAQGPQPTAKKMVVQFDFLLNRFKSINLVDKAEVKKSVVPPSRDAIFDATLTALNSELEKSRKEISAEKSGLTSVNISNAHYIDKDIMPMIGGIPEPVTSLPEARKLMNVKPGTDPYSVYIEKIKRLQEQYAEEARSLYKPDIGQIKYDAEKNAARAMQNLQNNSLVQEAGGLEKLQQMTPEQRAAWGKQMAEKARNNSSAYSGIESDPRKAFTQKMMKDPGYAARFQHMNQAQQQEEYKLFMKDNGFVDNEASKSASIQADHREASMAIAITQQLTDIMNHSKQLAAIAGAARQRTDNYFSEVNLKLNNDYTRRVEALPLVEHGEAGKSKDTYPVDIAYNVVVYSVETQNAVSNKEVWKCYLESMKIVFAEYNDFLSEYWGKDKKTDELMTKQNQTPPALMAGFCGEIIHMTEMAGYLSHQNAGWQQTYDEKVLHLYESIRE